MSSYSSSRTTKTYSYSSSGGPGQTTVTEVRTSNDGGGTKTETRTFGGGDVNFNSNFGNMDISNGQRGGGITRSTSKPVESRYSKGWGGSRKAKSQGPPMQLEGKTFEEIKAQCLREGRLFEDPDFPAVNETIFYSRAPPRPFVWKRPGDICTKPQLFVGGASRFDVKQGELGDCWLLAAVASLCIDMDLVYRVIPQDQSFEEGYAGIFRFQFWQYGEWKEVIVDDRLPTYYDKLVFMHSESSNEFWTPLLEKAYAKLNGSYEALKGGTSSEAMEDFTGGVTEMFDFRQDVPKNLFTIMMKAKERHSLMGCSIEAMPGKTEAELANGLIMGHAYSITGVELMDIKTTRTTGKIPMVRIRNPWGNEAEWKGAWSDKSPEWQFISEEERKEIGLTFNDDGEFWMSYSDFTKNFQKLEICNLGPDALHDSGKKSWESANVDGAWKKKVNAGGCRNYLDTFWTNPQYRVDVVDCDDDDDVGTIIVGLMQKDRRKLRKEGVDLLTMGYVIYKVPDDQLNEQSSGPLDMRFFKYNASVAKSPSFINLREICGRHALPPGQYCIIPSTFEPQQPGDFLLRIFSEKESITNEMDEETSMSDVQVVQVEDKDGKPKESAATAEQQAVEEGGVVPVGDFGSHQPTVPIMIQDPPLREIPKQELNDQDKQQDKSMREAFKKIAGEDMEIDAYELQDIINVAFKKEFTFDGFSSDTCRSMVAMMDVDQSGKLGYDEFKKLWNDLRLWKSVFKQFDKDGSGNFNSYEMRQAFHASGFRVSNSTFNALVQRYSHKDGKIHFDDYIHCTARLRTMFDTFKEQDERNTGKATFGLDEFIQTTMYS